MLRPTNRLGRTTRESSVSLEEWALIASVVFAGLLVSNRLAEPNYDRMLAWNPDHMPDEWQAVRRYYFRLNWIRAAATWTSFGLFLAALVDLL